MASGTTMHLRDVWGSDTDDVYAVGADGTEFIVAGDSGTILIKSGSLETMVPVNTADLEGVWGSPDKKYYFAVGENGTILYCYDPTMDSDNDGIVDALEKKGVPVQMMTASVTVMRMPIVMV